jgi:hypothetical protein
MRHKLKAVFDDRDEAQQALDELLASGYPRADADLVTVPGIRSGSPGVTPAPRWRERPGASTARLLSRVLGQAGSRPLAADVPPDVPDSHILTLWTETAEEAERAASLVSGFMQLRGDAAGSGKPGAPAGLAYVLHRRAAVPGALQFDARDINHDFGTHDTDAASITGTSSREPILPAGHWPGLSLFDLPLPTGHAGLSDAGAAAYRFGRDMHENPRYRNRSWHESDADLKELWEAGDAARPAWDAFAPAVRLGWDSTSPEIDDDSYHRNHWRTAYPNSAKDTGSNGTSAAPQTESLRGNPGAPTAWENFIDALRHGWNRTRIGHDMDETDYRLHHARTYPGTNYDDLAPVYRYGHHVRGRAMFQERSWEDAEDELQAEWERGHREGKPATWDEMKAALHVGWDHDRT